MSISKFLTTILIVSIFLTSCSKKISGEVVLTLKSELLKENDTISILQLNRVSKFKDGRWISKRKDPSYYCQDFLFHTPLRLKNIKPGKYILNVSIRDSSYMAYSIQNINVNNGATVITSIIKFDTINFGKKYKNVNLNIRGMKGVFGGRNPKITKIEVY